MSACTNAASARIFARGVVADAVSAATFCLISGEGSRRPRVRLRYQEPISVQLTNPRFWPPGGNSEINIAPATPRQGGISPSGLIALMSLRAHCVTPLEFEVGGTSAWFAQTALYSQPDGSCRL